MEVMQYVHLPRIQMTADNASANCRTDAGPGPSVAPTAGCAPSLSQVQMAPSAMTTASGASAKHWQQLSLRRVRLVATENIVPSLLDRHLSLLRDVAAADAVRPEDYGGLVVGVEVGEEGPWRVSNDLNDLGAGGGEDVGDYPLCAEGSAHISGPIDGEPRLSSLN